MIYKNKHKYKTLERRMGKIYVASYRGYKVKVNELMFYVNEKLNKVTEEQTGLGFFVPEDTVNNLESIEKYIESVYEKVVNNVNNWIQKKPELQMALHEEGPIE
jgi:hypothetical protein